MDLYGRFVERLLGTTGLTAFEKRVLMEVANVKPGRTITYGELASKIGKPKAARAVGNALHKNPFIIIVPCHRAVASNGIGGYGRGILMKKVLLGAERTVARYVPA